MNIVNIGGAFFKAALTNMGHNVYLVGFESNCDWPVTHPFTASRLVNHLESVGFEPDVLIYCDNGNLPYILDPQNLPWLNFWYSIDTYCNPWHIPYAHGFDLALVAQKDFVPLFTNEGIKAVWLPLFCQHSLASQEFSSERDVPVSFVGHVGHKNNKDRLPFLQRFRRIHPLVMYQGDFVPLFSRSKIVLNQLAFGEVNFRCFEAAACGAALLTETCDNGLDELFVIGQEILPTYPHNDAAKAAQIAKDALAKPNLAQIAKAGQGAVLKRHTDLVRARFLEQEWSSLLKSDQKSVRLKKELDRRTTLVASAFGVLASEESNESRRNLYQKIFTNAVGNKSTERDL